MCNAQRCNILPYTVLYCTMLNSILYYTTSPHTTLYYTILHHPTQHYITEGYHVSSTRKIYPTSMRSLHVTHLFSFFYLYFLPFFLIFFLFFFYLPLSLSFSLSFFLSSHQGKSLDFVHLDSLMTVLGLSNRWAETVPKRFVAAVFISGG